ncbi:MAG: RNA polymerase sigma factor [Candidatus Omnitrophica bacterium]|nr:RNA polymerase sigma factor [Candidatus Omnitrophota bacterium]
MQDISAEIIQKASEGDLPAFENIYKAASSFVFNVAFRVVHNREEAEEVTQDVFMNVFRKLKDFRQQASFKTWVYRITVNCAINHYRKTAEHKKRSVEFDERIVSEKVFVKQEPAMTQEEHQGFINELLDNLNPDQRLCVVLRNIEGLSYQEIADSLNININTVRSRLKRAREALINFNKVTK